MNAAVRPEPTIVNIDDYSSYNRLMRPTAWMQRFTRNCRHTDARKKGPLDATELQEAEIYWIRRTQDRVFGPDVCRMNIALQRFSPYHDKLGLLRLGSHLQFSNLRESSKHFILLPASDTFTKLLVKKEHQRLLHAGFSFLLTELRERFWTVRARQVVKKVINECTVCRRYSCKQYLEPFTLLTADRVQPSPPFEVGCRFCWTPSTKR